MTDEDSNSRRRLDVARSALSEVRRLLKQPMSRSEAEVQFEDDFEDDLDALEGKILAALTVYEHIEEIAV
jgi:hypothetical protein